MEADCPSCGGSINTIVSNSKNWRGDRHEDRRLTDLLVRSGVPLVEDWLHCTSCGYNGSPKFTRESAAEFVRALEREAGACCMRGEWVRARRRYVRALSIFPDYSPALAALACTFIDAPDKHVEHAEELLLYCQSSGFPRLPYVDWLLGRLFLELGRRDDAHYFLSRYINRDRAATVENPFPNYPHDATDDAGALLTGLLPPLGA
jgi:hypothetical protein